MSLESNQFQHDGLQVAKNNLSGSNDPHQLNHDLNEQLIKGAKRAAALNDLDIDEADYFALASSRAQYSPEQEERIGRVMGESNPESRMLSAESCKKRNMSSVMREMPLKLVDCPMP